MSRHAILALISIVFSTGCGDPQSAPSQPWSFEEPPQAADVVDARLEATPVHDAVQPEFAWVDVELGEPRACVELFLVEVGPRSCASQGGFSAADVSPSNWCLARASAHSPPCLEYPESDNEAVATAETARGRIELVEANGTVRHLDRLILELRFEDDPSVDMPREVFLDLRDIEGEIED